MNKKTNLKQQKKAPAAARPGAQAPLSAWFPAQLSRRTVGKGLAWTAILGMAGVTIAKLAGDDEPEVTLDSLDLQKKQGWNVGSTNKGLTYGEGWTATDSRGKTWSALDPNYLISIYQPHSAQWQPFFVPTLIQSLAQPTLGTQVKMLNSGMMRDAYDRAGGLRNLISQSPNANQTLVISDLPGPASVAVSAALADTAQIVPGFDNWPHPLGVVRSHETLGAMLYYAHEIEEKRGKVGDDAPALLLLDGNRLSSYTDQDSQFDNRYLAKLPTADQLKSRNIANIIYLVKDPSQTQELDDINDDFVEWQKQGVNIRILPLTQFQAYDAPAGAGAASTAGAPGSTVHRHYYYGGSPLTHLWFYSHYAYRSPGQVVVMRDGLQTRIPRPTTGPTFDPPNYRPTSRPTVFSSSKIGGAAGGVGKTRPSGFGRTSVRMSSGGSITGVRSGRSGSYGRSGGGWFGG
ncbi:MAG: hypothetical protein ACKVX9_18665 [Blastocatellia bacterium]